MAENIKPDKQKVPAQSMDIKQPEIDKLKTLFPQCFVQGKLDFDRLRALCDDYIIKEHERYSFEWNGKTDAYRLAAKRSMGTLRPCPAESVNFDSTNNLYIEGDNLEVLKQLQKSYFNQVKMIYIDPPYNTGNDFVYTDDFAAPLNKYKEITQQTTKSNPETMGRFHTNWLNMMLPRLRLAYNLLRDDGVIFISIDDNEVTNLRKLCDEVFGEENLDIMLWRKSGVGRDGKMKNTTTFRKDHEYIMVCFKSLLLLNKSYEKPNWQNEYGNPDNDPRGNYKSGVISKKEEASNPAHPNYYTVTSPNGKQFTRQFDCPKEEFEKLNRDNRIYWGKNGDSVPAIKIFVNEKREVTTSSIIDYKDMTTTAGSKELENLFGAEQIGTEIRPKPVSLIKKLVTIATNSKNNDIILDFFSGSATTAHAVMQLNAEDGGNRRFICVQLPELCDEKTEAFKAGYKNICEIGKERIRRAGKKILDEYKDKLPLDRTQPLDTGFKVFKLDSSNLVTWDASPIKDNDVAQLYGRMDALASTIKKDRTDLDLVYEVMLKLGVPLTQRVKKLTVNGKEIWSVGKDHTVLVCLNFDNKSITQQDIETLCEKYAPAQIVAAEGAFKDDSALSNAYYTLNNRQVLIKLI